MNDSKRQQCRFITQKHNNFFFNKRNVVGMGFGNKIIKGVNTGEPCFKVFVAKKESASILKDGNMIPKFYKGMKTDIIQTGKLTFSSLSEKNLPLKFGYSIGPNGVSTCGTAGCLVKDSCGNYYILSNNHILSNFDELPIGTPILHPGVYDSGKYPDDLIAYLSKKIQLLYSTEDKKNYNYVDCAIAKIINPNCVTKKIAFVGGIKGVQDAEIGMHVKKVGRTTELTTGIITELDALVELAGPNDSTELFDNQIITTYMSFNGDSGSLLLDSDNHAIGLLNATGDSFSISNPIKEVLKALKVSLVTC